MSDLSVMWACTDRQAPLDRRDFGALYWMDSEGIMHNMGLIEGPPETPEGFYIAIG